MPTKRKPKPEPGSEFIDESLVTTDGRMKTFKRWRFNKSECSQSALAEAGFIHTGKDTAKCVFCFKELEWERNDIPSEEHARKQPECPFVRLGQRGELHDVSHCGGRS